MFLFCNLHRYRDCRRKEWSQHAFVRNDWDQSVHAPSSETFVLFDDCPFDETTFSLLKIRLTRASQQPPNSSHFHVAKIRDDETGLRDSRVIFQAYRLPWRSCHRCRKQYFLNRPYKPAINFPRPSRNFPNTSSLLLVSLNTARDISTTLKS